jgi:hypothetical protein
MEPEILMLFGCRVYDPVIPENVVITYDLEKIRSFIHDIIKI